MRGWPCLPVKCALMMRLYRVSDDKKEEKRVRGKLTSLAKKGDDRRGDERKDEDKDKEKEYDKNNKMKIRIISSMIRGSS